MTGKLQTAYLRTTTPPHFTRHLTSWLLPPLVLAGIRALIALYIFSTLFTIIGIQLATADAYATHISFAYFTILTWWGLGFYFAISAIHGLRYSRGLSGFAKTTFDDRASGGRVALRWAHGWFYATVTVFPLVVSGVFWGVLASGALYDRYSTWANVSEHALNSVFALFEIVLPRTEATPWIHLIPVVFLLALYLGLAYLVFSIDGFYVYPFLDIGKNGSGLVAGVIVGILVAVVIVFALVHFVIGFRRWITETKLGMTGKLAEHDSGLGRTAEKAEP